MNPTLPDEDVVSIELDGKDVARLTAMGFTQERAQEIIDELGLSHDINLKLKEMVQGMQDGKTYTAIDFKREINAIGERYGHDHGLPMPDISESDVQSDVHPLVLADRTLRTLRILQQVQTVSSMEERLQKTKLLRNSWTSFTAGGPITISVVQTERGPEAFKTYHDCDRGTRLLDNMIVRSRTQITAEAEEKALASLKKKISTFQYASYVLNGAFPETSKRSGVMYVLRKGYPTIALRYRTILAALCLHPMGYYKWTLCGAMAPTDEVISHLMMMRGDERKYWAKSGQWPVWDPRSGV